MTATTPRIAQRGPFAIDVVEGKNYAWCACGLSKRQPFCDGSHKHTGLSPVLYKAQKSETLYFCGCKHSKTPPFCDGTHEGL